MTAKCIATILEPNYSSPPSNSSEAKVSEFGLYNKQGEFKYDLPFIDAINNSTKKLGANCSKDVNAFITRQMDRLKTGSGKAASKLYSATIEDTWFDNLIKDTNKLIDDIEKGTTKLEKMLCNVIVPFFKTLTALIDIATKILPLLYKKIQKMRSKLEAALVDFTNTVKSCMITIISQLKSSIDHKIKQALQPTIDTTFALMYACPCATEIIAKMFGCEYNDAGDKNETPEAVYACIKDKFSFLDPSVIVDAYNNAINKYLINNVSATAAFLENLVKNTIELLLAPIRELMRVYGKILNTKIDMSFFLNFVGPFDCLFIYTTEYDGAGVDYKGMSIIDMINSIKSWSSCFEFVCTTFVDDSTAWLKNQNDTLKLSESFWRDLNIIDLYQATIGYKLQSYPPSALMIRKLFTSSDTNGKKTFVDVVDVFKQLGLESAKGVRFNNPFEKKASQKNAVIYNNNNENDSPNKSDGLSELNTGIETRLMQMEATLAADNNEYYVSKFSELVEFETIFTKSDEHNTQTQTLFDNQTQIGTNFTGNTILMQPITERQIYSGIEPLPTYSIPTDYSQTEADKIENSTLPQKNTSETMTDYYKRCFIAIT